MSESHPGSEKSSTEALEKAALQDEQIQDVHAQLMREKEEPSEGFSPTPILIVFIFAALCFWGGMYLVENSGGFKADIYTPDHDAQVEVPLVVYDPIKRGKKVFVKQCVQCHQSTGKGVGSGVGSLKSKG